jgi:hypothetical protein
VPRNNTAGNQFDWTVIFDKFIFGDHEKVLFFEIEIEIDTIDPRSEMILSHFI